MDIWCAIRTYPKHAAELGNQIPQEPAFFLKATSCLASPNTIDTCDGDVHHEVELVLKLGEDLSPIEMAVGLDLTKRSIQDRLKSGGLPWAEAKAFRGSAIVSEWVAYDSSASFSLMKNGEFVQQGSLQDMHWTPEELIDRLTAWAPVKAGDILFTGTPAGVGPLQNGDRLTATLNRNEEHVASFSIDCV